MSQFNKFYYKPLPDFLQIGESDIEGSGVFAKEYIEEDKYVLLENDIDKAKTRSNTLVVAGDVKNPLGFICSRVGKLSSNESHNLTDK
mgnify:CR=1 FL=1